MKIIHSILSRNRANPLSRSDISALITRSRAGDISARNRIIEANLGLIFRVVNHMAHLTPSQREEALQDGVLGMIRAVELFDPRRGFAFSTYADWWIHQSIWREQDQNGHLIRLPSHVLESQKLLARLSTTYSNRSETKIKAICARRLRKSVAYVERIDKSRRELTHIDRENEDGERFIDIEDVNNTDMARLEADDAWALLDGLDKRIAEVLRYRAHGKDLSWIGKRLGLSRERVRQLEADGLKKLRKMVHVDDNKATMSNKKRRDSVCLVVKKKRPLRSAQRVRSRS